MRISTKSKWAAWAALVCVVTVGVWTSSEVSPWVGYDLTKIGRVGVPLSIKIVDSAYDPKLLSGLWLRLSERWNAASERDAGQHDHSFDKAIIVAWAGRRGIWGVNPAENSGSYIPCWSFSAVGKDHNDCVTAFNMVYSRNAYPRALISFRGAKLGADYFHLPVRVSGYRYGEPSDNSRGESGYQSVVSMESGYDPLKEPHPPLAYRILSWFGMIGGGCVVAWGCGAIMERGMIAIAIGLTAIAIGVWLFFHAAPLMLR